MLRITRSVPQKNYMAPERRRSWSGSVQPKQRQVAPQRAMKTQHNTLGVRDLTGCRSTAVGGNRWQLAGNRWRLWLHRPQSAVPDGSGVGVGVEGVGEAGERGPSKQTIKQQGLLRDPPDPL